MPDPTRAFAEERRAKILHLLDLHGRVRIEELVEEVGASAPTIRKDLDRLERLQRARRTHGGAIPWTAAGEPDVRTRASVHIPEKYSIARAAYDLINEGDAIFLDSGTTVRALAELLEPSRVNVLTNSVDVAVTLADRPMIEHTLLGGTFRSRGGSMVGPIAIAQVQRFTVTTAFLGITGLTEDGIWCADVGEAQVKSWVAEHAHRVVVLMDHSKYDAVDFAFVSELANLDVIVTDAAPDGLRDVCDRFDVELIVADAH